MDEKELGAILRKNPQVDRRMLKQAREALRDMRALGVKCPFPSAQPPYGPYSSSGSLRRLYRPPSRQARRANPSSQ